MKKTRASYRGAGPYVVEVSGLEPLTPYMRRKAKLKARLLERARNGDP